jgi:hypothetical protein
MCYCIDVDVGATHKPEVFDAVSLLNTTLSQWLTLDVKFEAARGPSDTSRV